MERDKIDTIKSDAADLAGEAKHRVQAGAEKAKRGLEGDAMPLGERIASHVKEAGHDVAADLDRAKRDVRDAASRDDR
jgi:thioesterase domain-containing protein